MMQIFGNFKWFLEGLSLSSYFSPKIKKYFNKNQYFMC